MIHKDFNCEIYFIRHGESESNATPGLASGVNYDAPLTKLGHQQAKLLGERFKNEKMSFDKVFSSTLTRAVQTTDHPILLNINLEIEVLSTPILYINFWSNPIM